jgi:hypothetical protein
VKRKMENLSFEAFATLYCETQQSTPESLVTVLESQVNKFQPTGWFLSRCEDMCSSKLGNQVILPYGPANTFKEIPASRLVRPHAGSACTYSVVANLSLGEFNAR